KKMNDNTQTLYTDRVVCIQQLSRMRFEYDTEIVPTAQNVRDHALTFSQATERLLKAEKIIDTNWRIYKLTYFTPEEKILVGQTEQIKKQADETIRILLSILAAKDTSSLNKLIIKGAFTQPAPFALKINQLLELQVRVSKQILHDNKVLYQRTSRNFVFFILLSLIVALSLSFYIIKNIKGLFKDILKSNSIIKKNEDELKKSEEKYRTLIEQASDAIYMVNFNGNFTDANESMCKMTGYSKEELLKLKVDNVIDPEQLKIDPIIHGYHKEGRSFIRERRILRKDRTTFDVEINVKKFAEDQVLVIARDITERKIAEELILKEKELSETIINSLPGIFYLRDQNGRGLRWNRNLETVTGYGAQEINGAVLREFIVPEDQGIISETAEKVFKDGYAYTEAKVLTKEGTRIPFLLTGKPIVYEDQLCLLGTGIDISSRIKAEEALRQSEANLKTIMDATDIAYVLLDKELSVVAYNHMAIKFVNSQFHQNPVKGDKLADYFPKERYGQFLSYTETVLKGENISYEINYPQTDGSAFWYSVRMFPIANNQNEIFGLMIEVANVTDRKLSDIQLRELNESLQKHARELAISNAELEQFAYVASHDLQEPLRMVTSFMAQLERKYSSILDEKGRQYINFAMDGAKRMKQIILDLLEFSRVGHLEDDQEDVDVNQLIKEIIILHRKQIEETKAKITYSNLPNLHSYRTAIRQVFQNLISNSLKYCEKDETPIINITCQEAKKFWQFSVSDNGIGINEEYFDKIFIIFQRLHNKEDYSGTGMGLAITKKIVENLGGKIWVGSREGKGSTFYFTVPKPK
ncbi:MAG: PAS domain S-box protein, partial [Mucilaginibacter sp.]